MQLAEAAFEEHLQVMLQLIEGTRVRCTTTGTPTVQRAAPPLR
jgi:hypothetical protein